MCILPASERLKGNDGRSLQGLPDIPIRRKVVGMEVPKLYLHSPPSLLMVGGLVQLTALDASVWTARACLTWNIKVSLSL